MQTDLGVWYPMGGTRAVPQALEKLAGELGVDLRPSCRHRAHPPRKRPRQPASSPTTGEIIRLSRRRLQHGQPSAP